MSKIEESLKNAPIIKKGEYNYVIHPITDGVPYIEPSLLGEVVDWIAGEMPSCSRIVTMEAMGIPIAAALSVKTSMPFTIIRKRSYGLPGEVSVKQVTGYSSSSLFINGLGKGDEIVIVDDVLSTGGTLTAVVSALKSMEVSIKGIFIAVNKGNLEEIRKKIGMNINTLVNIEVNGKVRIKD